MSEHKRPKDPRTADIESEPELKQRPAENLEKLKNMKVPTRRVRRFMVKPADFMFLFTKGLKWRKNTTIIKGVPEDAVIIAVVPDSVRNGIMMVVQSASFEEIPYNVLPPTDFIEIDVGVANATKKKKVPRKK